MRVSKSTLLGSGNFAQAAGQVAFLTNIAQRWTHFRTLDTIHHRRFHLARTATTPLRAPYPATALLRKDRPMNTESA